MEYPGNLYSCLNRSAFSRPVPSHPFQGPWIAFAPAALRMGKSIKEGLPHETYFSFIVLIGILLFGAAGCAPSATSTPTATLVPSTATPIPATPTLLPRLDLPGCMVRHIIIALQSSKVIYFDPISLTGICPGRFDPGFSCPFRSLSVSDIQKVIGSNTFLIIRPERLQLLRSAKSDLGIPGHGSGLRADNRSEWGRHPGRDGVRIRPPHEVGGDGYIVSIDGPPCISPVGQCVSRYGKIQL